MSSALIVLISAIIGTNSVLGIHSRYSQLEHQNVEDNKDTVMRKHKRHLRHKQKHTHKHNHKHIVVKGKKDTGMRKHNQKHKQKRTQNQKHEHMHLAFVSDCSAHQAWMATMLYHSAMKVGQDDPIVWLRWHCQSNSSAIDEKKLKKIYPKASVVDISGREYKVAEGEAKVLWIKPLAFETFMKSSKIPDDSVVAMLDADFIFLTKLRLDNLADRSISSNTTDPKHHITTGAPDVKGLNGIAAHYLCCDDMGVPYILTAKAWRKLLPEWSKMRFDKNGGGWSAEQAAFAKAAKNVGVSFRVFDHFMVSTPRDPHVPEGWEWVKEALKTPEGDVCKNKITHETTRKLPTVFHWNNPLKANGDWVISKYQVPPGWKKEEGAGILDCEMSLLAEPPENLIQVARSETDQLAAWSYCIIIHSLNSMLTVFKEANCPKPYNDMKALKVGINWINTFIPDTEGTAKAKGMNFTFMKTCGEQYKCNRR